MSFTCLNLFHAYNCAWVLHASSCPKEGRENRMASLRLNVHFHVFTQWLVNHLEADNAIVHLCEETLRTAPYFSPKYKRKSSSVMPRRLRRKTYRSDCVLQMLIRIEFECLFSNSALKVKLSRVPKKSEDSRTSLTNCYNKNERDNLIAMQQTFFVLYSFVRKAKNTDKLKDEK